MRASRLATSWPVRQAFWAAVKAFSPKSVGSGMLLHVLHVIEVLAGIARFLGVRGELDDALPRLAGFVGPLLLAVQIAEVQVRLKVTRVQLQQLPISLSRLCIFAELPQRDRQVQPEARLTRRQVDGFAEVADSGVQVVGFVGLDAE